jgi:hypothetical protein
MHYLEMLHEEGACGPAMKWMEANAGLSAKEKWGTCPDGSWQAWMLGLPRVRKHLPPEALKGLRDWALKTSHRAITIRAPNALRAAAACHPEEKHRAAMLKHAETLAAIKMWDSAAAAAARYAAAAARYAYAAAAADAADAQERKTQADDLRTCVRWEWVEEALKKAGVEL